MGAGQNSGRSVLLRMGGGGRVGRAREGKVEGGGSHARGSLVGFQGSRGVQQQIGKRGRHNLYSGEGGMMRGWGNGQGH